MEHEVRNAGRGGRSRPQAFEDLRAEVSDDAQGRGGVSRTLAADQAAGARHDYRSDIGKVRAGARGRCWPAR